MQNVLLYVGGAALFAAGVAVGTGSQDAKKEPDAKKAAAEQDAGGAYGVAPGAEHKRLAADVGVWKAKMWMADEKGVMQGPQPATETVRMDLGGLWQIADYDCPKAPVTGAPFKGHGVMGYDPTAKRYLGMWFDNWTATPTEIAGVYEKDGKTFVAEAAVFDTRVNQVVKPKYTTKYADANHRTFTIAMTGEDGKDSTVVKIEYEKDVPAGAGK